jgi:hypothetical protein
MVNVGITLTKILTTVKKKLTKILTAVKKWTSILGVNTVSFVLSGD